MSDVTESKEQEAPKTSQGGLMKLWTEQPLMLLLLLFLGGGSGSAITNLTDRDGGLSVTDIEAVRQVVKEALAEQQRLTEAQMETRDLNLANACEALVEAHVKEYHKP